MGHEEQAQKQINDQLSTEEESKLAAAARDRTCVASDKCSQRSKASLTNCQRVTASGRAKTANFLGCPRHGPMGPMGPMPGQAESFLARILISAWMPRYTR